MPQPLSWQSVFGFGSLFFVAVGTAGTGLWAISQTQLGGLRNEMQIQNNALSANIEQLRREQISGDKRLSDELTRREAELKGQLRIIQDELDRRRNEFLNVAEFRQFEKRVIAELDTIKKQLTVLESTRPTTGELGGLGKTMELRMDRIEERVRQIEQNSLMRSAPKQ